MNVIGVTGRTGSGKSTVCGIFARHGAEVIDADKIAHEVLLKGGAAYNGVIEVFGPSVLDSHGEIDRKSLGALVFNDIDKLLKLNGLTHTHILAEIYRRIDESGLENVIIDAPLLYESGLDDVCDITVAVTAPENIRINRLIERDALDQEAAAARIKSQYKYDDPASKADYVLENNIELEEFLERAYNLARLIVI